MAVLKVDEVVLPKHVHFDVVAGAASRAEMAINPDVASTGRHHEFIILIPSSLQVERGVGDCLRRFSRARSGQPDKETKDRN